MAFPLLPLWSLLLALLRPGAAEWNPELERSFTAYLRAQAGEVWHAATHHPMTDAIAAGTVPNATMRRYLIQDHLFLDAFSALLAAAASVTPALEDRVPLVQFNALVLGPENTYFQRSFEALEVSKDERRAAAASPLAPTGAFIRLMRSAARSGRAEEMLAVLVVAEWSYLAWGERVQSPSPDVPFWCREWVDLHRGEDFAAVVAHLRSLLDGLATSLCPAALARSRANFLAAVALERDFWDVAWSGESTDALLPQDKDCPAAAGMGGLEMIERLRLEPSTLAVEAALLAHPLLAAAEAGTLTLAQRRAFAAEQLAIQRSDAASFARLAGHDGSFLAGSLIGATVPPAASTGPSMDLFQFLLGGELYAAPLLLSYAKSVGFKTEQDMEFPRYNVSKKAQAYPSFWARLALGSSRAAGAAACAVNFPAWGRACKRLRDALASPELGYYSPHEDTNASLAFLDFFAAPIDGLDAMAAAVIDSEAKIVSYDDLITPVRLLQEYEVQFWDSVYQAADEP